MLHFDPAIIFYTVYKGNSYCLVLLKLSTHAECLSIADSVLLHSHHVCLKYSSRIKRTPLASWPLMKLGRSISYHSSCVACQAGRSPDETMRAHIRGWGGSLGCSHGHCYAHHLPVLTIFRKFKAWHSWIHKGVLRSGPTFACQKCVWVIEGEIWPSWALKRSKSMDSAILKGNTAQLLVFTYFCVGSILFQLVFTNSSE